MKLTTLALTTLLPATALSATCGYEGGWVHKWRVTADNVYGISGWCGGLWDNMKSFQGDCPISDAWCGGENGLLEWKFTTPSTCGPGAVEAAWWEATKNEFGAIVCGL
ncbi:hypothetical protein GGP41_007431 [Bipolaris sorokiniana]|uniref:Uncharacterized protein n=2 Tax=Cochliobolus sativus TaxID=45130 RepID=A0A8H5ZPS8_COCSA|nr:hypothetical protein GGP41_007431 [Bipolaris sorokiniana]